MSSPARVYKARAQEHEHRGARSNLAAGCGLAVGIGISLRTRERISRSAGILIGAVVGMVVALLTGLIPGSGVGLLVPPLVGLASGLADGFGTSRLRGYREAGVEALIVAVSPMSQAPAATAALPSSSSPPSKPQPSFFVRAMTIPAAIRAALCTVCSQRAMRFGVSQRRAITVRVAGARGCRGPA